MTRKDLLAEAVVDLFLSPEINTSKNQLRIKNNKPKVFVKRVFLFLEMSYCYVYSSLLIKHDMIKT